MWVIWEEERKGDEKGTCHSISSLNLSPNLETAKSSLLEESHLTAHGHSSFNMSITRHITPHHSAIPVSSYLLPICLLAIQAKTRAASWTPLFIHCHIYPLTNPTNFSFQLFICKNIALALVFIISGLISLSLVSCPVSHKLDLVTRRICPRHDSSSNSSTSPIHQMMNC